MGSGQDQPTWATPLPSKWVHQYYKRQIGGYICLGLYMVFSKHFSFIKTGIQQHLSVILIFKTWLYCFRTFNKQPNILKQFYNYVKLNRL